MLRKSFMQRVLTSLACVALLFALRGDMVAQRKPSGAKPSAQAGKSKPKATPAVAADEATLKAKLDEIVKLATAERVGRLEELIKSNPDSPQTARARELLAGARAALGDEKLRSGDRAGGVEMFRAVVADAPAVMSDKFFVEIVAQLPANLYALGERAAALELARAVEERAAGSASRLLHVASFYLGIEQADDAARVAQAAIALRPDLAAAHRALGTAHRYALRLDEAASEFSRALDLDSTSASTRRTLAELRRATGKPEDALALYREQLAADPQDAVARHGVVLALFDAGRREEAERELQTTLTGEAKDLPLLVGASYWHAAHGNGARALELAEKAVALEPRFGWAWARIAQGRALLALKRPLEAERALRAARKFGNFPTLDYELAAALASAGLYEEAAEALSRSFTVRDGQVETRLAGRIESKAADFNDLLAPERRASLSQFAGASTAAEARMLKALLAFHQATKAEGADEKAAAEAAREFGAGEDEMRAYRNLYAASRLDGRGAAQGGAAFERAEAAIAGVEAALAVPHAPVALFAETDEIRQLRQQVVEQDTPLNVLNVQRDVLSKVMRGRIEALAGWALYNQGQTAEAAVRLRRAVSVLPESSSWWRTAEWRLGAALEANGGGRDALAAYVNSYRAQPDPTRRAAIEALYKRLNNGSLKGLDALLAPQAATAANRPAAPAQTSAPPVETQTPTVEPAADAKTIEPTPATVEPTPSTPAPSPEPTSTPETSSSPAPTPESAATREATPTSKAKPTPETIPNALTTPTTEPSPAPSPEQKPEQRTPGGVCALAAIEPSLTIQNNGGSATVTLNLENYAGTMPPRINVSTPNWADILIIAEPRAASDAAGSSRFTITSTSRKTGAFVVTFASPCGKQDVTVNVK